MVLRSTPQGFSDIEVQIPLIMSPVPNLAIEETQQFLFPENPAFSFLERTLREYPAMRKVGDCYVFACRKWRANMKSDQINAMRALKAAPDALSVSRIGQEVTNLSANLTGARVFDGVASIPGASSGRHRNFSHLIAAAVSEQKKIPLVRPLKPRSLRAPRTSHPKTIKSYSVLETGLNVEGMDILIVDDVVTSGAHARQIISKLRTMGASVTFIAWISA